MKSDKTTLDMLYCSCLFMIINKNHLSMNSLANQDWSIIADELDLYLKPLENKTRIIIINDIFNYLSDNSPDKLISSNPCDTTSNIFSEYKGFELSWLLERFDLSGFLKKYSQLSDLPCNGWINESVGISSESLILTIAFLNYYQANSYYKKYKSFVGGRLLKDLPDNDIKLSSTLYLSTMFSSIQAFLNYMTFIECFVNSVAYDYCLTHDNLNETQYSFLSDKYPKIRHIPILYKLYYYPKIISSMPNLVLPVNLDNYVKIFKGTQNDILFDNYKELKLLRDSYIHQSQNPDSKKQNIIMTHHDWFKKAEDALNTCLRIAKIFWNDCGYTDGPKYLYNLEKDFHLSNAENLFINKTCADSLIIEDLKSKSRNQQ